LSSAPSAFCGSVTIKQPLIQNPIPVDAGQTNYKVADSEPRRKEIQIVNTGITAIYLKQGSAPVASKGDYHQILNACGTPNDGTGGFYISDIWQGTIYLDSSANGGTVVLAELI